MRLVPSAAVLALIVTGLTFASTAQAERIIGNCRTTDVRVVASDQFNSTTSGSYVPVPGMKTQIRQLRRGCIIVEFQAQAHAANTGNELISLDARLDDDDNDNYLGKSQPQFAASDGMWSVNRPMRFIWLDVRAGLHTVQIFYRSANGGDVSLYAPVMVVNYTK